MKIKDYMQDLIPDLENKFLLEIDILQNIEFDEDEECLILEFDPSTSEDQIEENLEKLCYILQDTYFLEIDYQEFIDETTVKIQLDIN